MNSNPEGKPISADELMDRLERDPQYLARREEADARWRMAVEQNTAAAAPVVKDLNKLGLPFQSLGDLRRSGIRYKIAVPVLLKWLPIIENTHIKDAIVRALSVPWARPVAALPLASEFQNAKNDAAGLKWAIGNALSVVADDSVFDKIAELVRDNRHGKAREMLAVALGNMKDPRAVDLLIELLRDEEVVGHALIALGKLRTAKARVDIEPLLKHHKPWVRKEARKALGRLV